MKNSLRSKSAVSLFEVIIAVFIISITSVAILTLLTSALQGTRISRDKMIAINLSYEGIDIARNAVETNWLKYSASREACWNIHPNATSCPGTTIQGDKNYTATIDPTDYSLELYDPAASGSLPDLNLRDEDVSSDDEKYRLFKDATTGLYVHNGAPENKSAFFRQIYIEYPDPDIMEIRSLVQWQEGRQVQDIEIVDRISNYQK